MRIILNLIALPITAYRLLSYYVLDRLRAARKFYE